MSGILSLPLPEPLAHLASWHGEDLQESITDLLRDVLPEGGRITRDDLEGLIREAFLSGVVAQITNPVIR